MPSAAPQPPDVSTYNVSHLCFASKQQYWRHSFTLILIRHGEVDTALAQKALFSIFVCQTASWCFPLSPFLRFVSSLLFSLCSFPSFNLFFHFVSPLLSFLCPLFLLFKSSVVAASSSRSPPVFTSFSFSVFLRTFQSRTETKSTHAVCVALSAHSIFLSLSFVKLILCFLSFHLSLSFFYSSFLSFYPSILISFPCAARLTYFLTIFVFPSLSDAFSGARCAAIAAAGSCGFGRC